MRSGVNQPIEDNKVAEISAVNAQDNVTQGKDSSNKQPVDHESALREFKRLKQAHLFFSRPTATQSASIEEEQKLLQEVDFDEFQRKSLEHIKKHSGDKAYQQWEVFCCQVKQSTLKKSEKLMLLQSAFRCLRRIVYQDEFAQLLTLSSYLIDSCGVRLFQLLFTAQVPKDNLYMKNYILACQLLLELKGTRGLLKMVKETLPNLSLLIFKLKEIHDKQLAAKYPERNIEESISRFKEKNDLVQFSLSEMELETIKARYLKVKSFLDKLTTSSQAQLCEMLKEDNEMQRLAILIESMRRIYKIKLYDTQILSILALINTPDKLKGRIAQIRTGEGKSSIIALLGAFMATKGQFVDIVTSSDYLSRRDCEKYKPFFESVGLTASHISHHQPKQEHFHAQILYGTNTDFEFAMLRDGLYDSQLRYSKRDGKLQPRTFDAVIVDEADNLFLDSARSSARMAIPGDEDISWVYELILSFIKNPDNHTKTTKEMIMALRNHLLLHVDDQYKQKINNFSDKRLEFWLDSARDALYKKKIKDPYIIKEGKDKNGNLSKQIVIVDSHTGRLNEGSEWQHGLHQFLQAKHGLSITPESLTAASLSHPTYFSLYKSITGLTGTMGEAVERDEIQKIYHVDSFDVPPHFPSQRQILTPTISLDEKSQYAAILQDIEEKQNQNRPVLVLFRTIKESEKFSKFLTEKNKTHQLLNGTQKESEDYLISRAGKAGMITVATNTAGRGTDIILSAESKKAGGLHTIFTFYPGNLRIEGQGFGRSGRQGQPGSCSMHLNYNDPFIQFLRKKGPKLDNAIKLSMISDLGFAGVPIKDPEKYATWLKDVQEARKQRKQASIDAVMMELQKERTKCIQEESDSRYISSQLEAIYFEKLQSFFNQMHLLYQTFSNELFKKLFLDACNENITEDKVEMPLNIKNGIWSEVEASATLLLGKQKEGVQVDWSSFYEQFKHTYLSFVRREWANFYSKMQDEVNPHDLDKSRTIVDQLYNEINSTLQSFLSNPEENILQCLHMITQQAKEELILEGNIGRRSFYGT